LTLTPFIGVFLCILYIYFTHNKINNIAEIENE